MNFSPAFGHSCPEQNAGFGLKSWALNIDSKPKYKDLDVDK